MVYSKKQLMNMKLAVLKGFHDKNDVTISGLPYAIGRCRSADFVIPHVNVSRNHCKIIEENKSWKIFDFSSSGTYVNDLLVGKGKTQILNDGDIIRFGPVENNLCWIFYSFDSCSETYTNSDIKPKTQVIFNFYNGKCSSKETNDFDKLINLDLTFKGLNNVNETEQEASKNCDLKTAQNEGESKVYQQAYETNNKKIVKESQHVKGHSHSLNGGNPKETSESEKIQELTKELQEVQSALNDLEEKNCALQEELAAGASSKVEASAATNLLENLADLMEAEFQCTICSELFVIAVTLSCTHTFCKYCISQWKKKQKTCPICRKKITSETRSLVVDNYIDKMVENLSLELKERREAIIKERNEIKPCKKKSRLQNKNL